MLQKQNREEPDSLIKGGNVIEMDETDRTVIISSEEEEEDTLHLNSALDQSTMGAGVNDKKAKRSKEAIK